MVLLMLTTALTDKLIASGAEFTEYLGANSVASFGNPAGELRALLSGCALSDLAWQVRLVISGEDRVRWTNGMVTNNIRDLAFEHGNYSLVLNAQGKIQGDVTIYNRGEYLLATTSLSQIERLREFFDRHIIMDDVEITDVSEKLTAFGISGPEVRKNLTAAGFTVPPLVAGQVTNAEWNGIGYSLARGVRADDEQPDSESFELWFASANAVLISYELVAA
jgi:aminomethyltransferase